MLGYRALEIFIAITVANISAIHIVIDIKKYFLSVLKNSGINKFRAIRQTIIKTSIS
jgi:hypothetical protein